MTDSAWTRREMFKLSAAAGAAFIGAPVLLAGCTSTSTSGSGSVLDNAKKAGFIKIGIAGEQPYGYVDKSGKVTGEAPEVARAIFQNLGVADVRPQLTSFDNLIQGLNAGQYDMVAAGMDITAKRCQSAQFSIPDYTALVAFLVPKGNPKNVKTFDDVKSSGVPIAVESGAVEKDYATAAGIPASQMQSFESPDELLNAVTTGRAYAAVLTDISFKNLVKQNPNAPVEVAAGFKPVVKGKAQGETGGFVFRKDETDLVNQFNTQLKQLQTSGKWTQIVEPFGFTADNIPAADVTTDSLCSAS